MHYTCMLQSPAHSMIRVGLLCLPSYYCWVLTGNKPCWCQESMEEYALALLCSRLWQMSSLHTELGGIQYTGTLQGSTQIQSLGYTIIPD